jgi:hypothetical protein
VIQKRDEVGDGAFKVDVIFPKRIVGIDQKRLRTTSMRFSRHRQHDNGEEEAWRGSFANFAEFFAAFAVKLLTAKRFTNAKRSPVC